MAWLSSVDDDKFVLSSRTASSSMYMEEGEREYESLGVLVKKVSYSQRFDVTEVTEVKEQDGIVQAAAEGWASTDTTTRERTRATFIVNPDDDESYQVKIPYFSREIVTTRSIAQSSSAGSYKLTLTTVTQTTEPYSSKA